MFNARKTYKAYLDFGIFGLYFVVVICKTLRFASLLRLASTTTNYKASYMHILSVNKICLFYIRY